MHTDNAEKKKGGGNNFTERPHDSNHTFTLRNIDILRSKFVSLRLLQWISASAYSIYCGVTRMRLRRFNLHKTNAANEELVISLFYGREVQERKPIYQLLHHYTA